MQVKKGGCKKNPRFEDWTSGKNYGKIKKKNQSQKTSEKTSLRCGLEQENASLRGQVEDLQSRLRAAEQQRDRAVELANDLSRALLSRFGTTEPGKLSISYRNQSSSSLCIVS